VALAAILLVGLVSNIAALLAGGERPVGDDFSWRAIANGVPTTALAHFLLHHNPLGNALVTADRVIAWNMVGDLGSRVRKGCGNWLFLTDELESHADSRSALEQNLKIIEQAEGFLRGRHIALAVALVPDKSRVETAELCGVDRAKVLAPRYESAAVRLQASGIAVIDLLRPLQALAGERYYRTDTHWNERGARTAAEAIAESLRHTGLAPRPDQVRFQVRHEPVHERVGDLIRLAGLDRVPLPFRPRGDIEAPTLIEQSAKPGAGILDEAPVPQVAVIGTSFSRRANFTSFLALALTAPVLNKAEDGGSLTKAAIAYFADPAFTAQSPRVIVWEIPERILDQRVANSDLVWAEGLSRGR
jgi:alginate O-acetyltransferase complex protein AlgJ